MSAYYFHTLFQASVPVDVTRGPDARGYVVVTLPDGRRRRVPAGVVSAEPVPGFPIRRALP